MLYNINKIAFVVTNKISKVKDYDLQKRNSKI